MIFFKVSQPKSNLILSLTINNIWMCNKGRAIETLKFKLLSWWDIHRRFSCRFNIQTSNHWLNNWSNWRLYFEYVSVKLIIHFSVKDKNLINLVYHKQWLFKISRDFNGSGTFYGIILPWIFLSFSNFL